VSSDKSLFLPGIRPIFIWQNSLKRLLSSPPFPLFRKVDKLYSQAALERAKTSDATVAEEEDTEFGQESNMKSESLDSVSSQMSQLVLSTTTVDGKTSSHSMEGSNAANLTGDVDKKIRALKKKVNLSPCSCLCPVLL